MARELLYVYRVYKMRWYLIYGRVGLGVVVRSSTIISSDRPSDRRDQVHICHLVIYIIALTVTILLVYQNQ